MTAPIVFGRLHVLPILMEFLKAYPDIDVRMVLADGAVNILDLAVRIGELPDSNLVARRVGFIRRGVRRASLADQSRSHRSSTATAEVAGSCRFRRAEA
jgi:DNA-binding transcriptional LysR family regulator